MLVRIRNFIYQLVPSVTKHILVPAHIFLHVDEPPRTTIHPQDVKDVVPGKPVTFTAQATGTEPLNYQWEWKLATDDGEWQPCDVGRFPGAENSTLTIPSVHEFNEGSYRCIITNCAGTQTSNSAELSVGKSMYNMLYIVYLL